MNIGETIIKLEALLAHQCAGVAEGDPVETAEYLKRLRAGITREGDANGE